MTQGQTEVKAKIAELETAIAASGNGKKAKKATKLLTVVNDDRSLGAHNQQKALSLLDEAFRIVTKKK